MQQRLEATLERLIAIPSVTTNGEACHAILEYVRSEIKSLGLFIHDYTNTPNPWLIATTHDTKEPDILLAAHLDVVPGGPELFTMRKENGKIYGRGAYDMKLAAACYIEFLKKHKDTLQYLNFGVLFTTDEEAGGRSVDMILESGWRPKVVFLPDGGDNWELEQRAKGLYGVELIAKGRTAHGSRPWEGDNALHTLLEAITVLRREFPSHSPNDSTLAINQMHAGTAINQIADYASAKVDFRTFSKEDMARYRALLDNLIKTYELELQVTSTGAPLLFDKTSPYVQSFLSTLRGITGKETAYRDSYGASDGRFFAQYDIPCIIIEPRGGGRHAPDEWLQADDLEPYYRLIEEWVTTFTLPATVDVS